MRLISDRSLFHYNVSCDIIWMVSHSSWCTLPEPRASPALDVEYQSEEVYQNLAIVFLCLVSGPHFAVDSEYSHKTAMVGHYVWNDNWSFAILKFWLEQWDLTWAPTFPFLRRGISVWGILSELFHCSRVSWVRSTLCNWFQALARKRPGKSLCLKYICFISASNTKSLDTYIRHVKADKKNWLKNSMWLHYKNN